MAAARPLAGGRVVDTRPETAEVRALIDAALTRSWRSRAELVGVQGARIGSGRTDGEFWDCEGWFLKSRATRRWVEVGPGREALATLHDRRRRLGPLVPARSALALIAAPDGGCQLWTLAPLLVTLRERLDVAAAAGAWTPFGYALIAFATGLGEAVTASVETGLGLDVNPANFAPQGARLRYLDDDVLATREALGLEDAFVGRFAEYPAAPPAVWEGYVRRTGDELVARAPAVLRTRLAARLRAAAILRRQAAAHADRLAARLEGTG